MSFQGLLPRSLPSAYITVRHTVLQKDCKYLVLFAGSVADDHLLIEWLFSNIWEKKEDTLL